MIQLHIEKLPEGVYLVDPRLLTRSIARHLESFAEHKVGAFTLHDLRRTVRAGLPGSGSGRTSPSAA
jgi:hypothetical protein